MKDFPEMKHSEEQFEVLKRKWRYLVSYAGVGFAKGYTTCHMWTFIRKVNKDSFLSRAVN